MVPLICTVCQFKALSIKTIFLLKCGILILNANAHFLLYSMIMMYGAVTFERVQMCIFAVFTLM